LRVSPVTDDGRAFVEWSASFDCPPERLGEWSLFFHDAFGRWLQSLRRHVDGHHVDGHHVDGHHVDGHHVDGHHVDGHHVDGRHLDGPTK
jgi:hypothetical protein